MDRRLQRRAGRGRGARGDEGQERDHPDGDLRRAAEGEIRYWLRIEDGGAAAGLGDLDGPDVTIRQSYETSAQVNRGELDGQKAFTQGKVKIGGKMLKMMQLRGPLAQVQTALARHRHRILSSGRARPPPRRARFYIQSACRGQASSVSTTSVGPLPGSVAAYRPR